MNQASSKDLMLASGQTVQDFAFDLLAKVLRATPEELMLAFDHFNYDERKKKKRSGGFRTYYAPHNDLLVVQRKLLKHFLYQLAKRSVPVSEFDARYEKKPFFENEFQGFLPKRSHVVNAKRHTTHFTRFILRIDLKDAFPSISKEMVREMLAKHFADDIEKYRASYKERAMQQESEAVYRKIKKLIGVCPDVGVICDWDDQVELNQKVSDWEWEFDRLFTEFTTDKPIKYNFGYVLRGTRKKFSWKENYERHPLFSARTCNQFRKMVRENEMDHHVQAILDSLLEQVLELVTYRGILVQGAATSGMLFNLVLKHMNVVGKMKDVLHTSRGLHRTLSIYADDFTIGFKERPSTETIDSIYEIFESQGLMINRDKTRVYDRNCIAPPITGYRLIRKGHTGSEIFPFKNSVGGAVKRQRTGGVWIEDKISIPKKTQRKMRAIFHQGATLPEVSDELHSTIAGYIGMVIHIYGGFISELPKGLSVPLNAYMTRFNKFKKL